MTRLVWPKPKRTTCLSYEQYERIKALREELGQCAIPFNDIEGLRWRFNELLLILLDEPGETSRGTDRIGEEAGAPGTRPVGSAG